MSAPETAVSDWSTTVAQMAVKLDEIRTLHRRTDAECADCEECDVPWPCETMRIVERVAL